MPSSGRRAQIPGWRVQTGFAFTRYCFASKLYCGSQSSFYCPSPLVKPTLLQYYCTTIAQYTPSHRHPFCMPCTIQYWLWQYRVKAKDGRVRKSTVEGCRVQSRIRKEYTVAERRYRGGSTDGRVQKSRGVASTEYTQGRVKSKEWVNPSTEGEYRREGTEE